MDSIAFDRLRESIKDAREIRLECLRSTSDISVIHERAVRLYFNLCMIFESVQSFLNEFTPCGMYVKRRNDLLATLNALRERFDSLTGPEREALLERARRTLPPRSHNDADAVYIAALELLSAGWRRKSE